MTKEQLLTKSLTAHALDEDELIQLRNESVTNLDDSASLPTAGVQHLGQSYFIKGIHYVCELVESVPTWVTYDTSGQNLSYADASGKPTLNGITINGTLTSSDLKLAPNNTARTQAATLATTDKIPINDDEYTTFGDIQQEIETIPLINESYQKLYIKSDNTLTETKATSTTSISLTNTTATTTLFSITFGEVLKLMASDEIKVGLYTTLTNAASYLFTFKLLIDSVEVATGTNTIVANSSRNDMYAILTNSIGDVIIQPSSVFQLQVIINRTLFTGTETITLVNDSNTSSYLYIKKSGILSNQIFHTMTTGLIVLYNSVNKKIDIITSTYNSITTISLNAKTSSTTGVEFTDNEHEFVFYNNSGSTITMTVENHSSLTPTVGSLRAASSISINNGQGAICKYQHVLIGSKMYLVIKQYQLLS